ncbi:chaperone protein dnaJ 20, chloroplastic-like [Asparagus officinalis]|uniref:chaperone protein dnaJ 20, chloroplastic-like n=1 Tax=Asparagus officinalis TaxID=4686 RepID=UPI00098E1D1D|nr:chaperone protein dnaJ 20, chloroplastic-like [Asparagus officinalis]
MQSQHPFGSPLPKLMYSFKKSPISVSSKVRPQDLTVDSSTMYDLLSVRETAGVDEIKAAYKKQARLWHPDVCPPYGNRHLFAEKFVKARKAYEVLSDPTLRSEYDSAISGGKGGGKFGGWESQIEGLKSRPRAASTWGCRMRRSCCHCEQHAQ